MSILAVAWDIDGTLVDSEPLHLLALLSVCDDLGLDLHHLPEDAFRGVHMHDVWTALKDGLPPGLERDDWIARITGLYVARSSALRPEPGAVETLSALQAMGMRQACVSNSSRAIVDANIRALGIEPCLEFTISFDDVSAGKPNPEPYRLAHLRFALEPACVAAVEDSDTGARSARMAGLFTIGYGRGGETVHDVDRLVARLADIPQLLPRTDQPTAASPARPAPLPRPIGV